MNERNLTLICIGCMLLILIPTSISNPNNLELTKEITPAGLEFVELVPDPYLSESPTVIVKGTSDEFSSLYYEGDSINGNHLNLTWTHTPSTELDFREYYDENLPECSDFIYTTQTIDWEYECTPLEVFAILDFTITTQGSFTTEDGGQIVFKLYIWLIDSSGNWIQIYNSVPPYARTGEYANRIINLDYSDTKDGWEGMVEDDEGTQEDPDNTLTIAVGLAPTHQFFELMGNEPWRIYNGSVVATIRHIGLCALVEEPPILEQTEPMYNGTLETISKDMIMASDDSVYLVGSEGSIDDSTNFNLTLSKMDAQANLLWSTSFDDGLDHTTGNGIDISPDGYIYTVGAHYKDGSDLLLIKWDMDGNVIWNKTWGLPHISGSSPIYYERGFQVLVSENGSIFTIGELIIINYDLVTQTNHAVLVKWDADGNAIWNITTPEWYMVNSQVEMAMFKGNILSTSAFDGLFLWSSTGFEILIETTAWDISVSDTNQITTIIPYNNINTTIGQWNEQGGLVWNTTWGYDAFTPEEYGDTYWHSHTVGKSITALADGTIYASGCSNFGGPGFLIKLDANGNQLWNISYGESWNGNLGGMGEEVEVGSNGLIYILNREEPGTLILVFEDPDIMPSDDFLMLIIIIAVIGVISLVAIVVIVQWRKG